MNSNSTFFNRNLDCETIFVEPTTEVRITPATKNTYIKYTSEIIGTSTLIVNTSNLEIGDTIVLFAFTGTDGGTIELPDDTFYFTQCGDVLTHYEIPISSRIVTRFTWDGELLVNTDDNC